METIIFENKKYLTREIYLEEFGDVLISTTSLNESLMNESGGYKSPEAEIIDEQIFYFVEDEQITLSDEELTEIITNEVI